MLVLTPAWQARDVELLRLTQAMRKRHGIWRSFYSSLYTFYFRSYLLATHGVNVPNLNNQINNVSNALQAAVPAGLTGTSGNLQQSTLAQSQWEPQTGVADTDVDGFLRVRKEMIIISAIEETHRRTQQAAAEAYQRKMQMDWKKQRAEILEELAGYSKSDSSDSRSGNLGRSMLGTVSD